MRFSAIFIYLAAEVKSVKDALRLITRVSFIVSNWTRCIEIVAISKGVIVVFISHEGWTSLSIGAIHVKRLTKACDETIQKDFKRKLYT